MVPKNNSASAGTVGTILGVVLIGLLYGLLNLYTTTTNAIGAEQKHIVDCVVSDFSNNDMPGKILSFDAMLAKYII